MLLVAMLLTSSFGRPTIEGTGVSVDVVVDLAKAGETHERIAKELRLKKVAVDDAVAWHELAAAA